MDTVTVSTASGYFYLRFSKLPDQKFGPYGFAEAIRDLRVSALLDPPTARDLVMDAKLMGEATTEVG